MVKIRNRLHVLVPLSVSALVATAVTAAPISAAQSAEAFVSDHFAGGVLDPQVWTVVDPVGDGTVSVSSGHLHIGVPAGTDHNPWSSADVPRVVQAVPNGDLTVEIKFTSVPTLKNQMQGLLFEAGPGNFARFDVHHNGTELRLFASTTVNGKARSKFNEALPSLAQVHLRVARTGTTWQLEWSSNGSTWNTATSFSETMALNQVGPFVGNAGGATAHAHTAAIDYVIDPSNPGDPGDPDPGDPDPGDPDPGDPGDTTPPTISEVVITPTATSASVQWSTDEPTTGSVDYGTTTAYGTTVTSSATGTSHTVNLTGLAADTTYHYQVSASDLAANPAQAVTGTFTTQKAGTGEAIDIWYGPEQTFGSPAQTQTWANILGNVPNASNLASLTYTLNEAESVALSVGPDRRRLQHLGDFNVDIAYGDLSNGQNDIVITAVWNDGATSTAHVTLNKIAGETVALPFTRDWSATTPLQAQASVVDGLWTTSNGDLRTAQTGYDRIIAIGDINWTDYEATVPMTVHGFGPGAYSRTSGAPMIGLGVRWQGHTVIDDNQPAWWWFPIGAYAWYRYHLQGARWELTGNNTSLHGPRGDAIPFNTPYVMKIRAETQSVGTRYSMKWWPANSPEPSQWTGVINDTGGFDNGSLVLIAHQLDATFGTVQVNPVTPSP